MIKKNQNKSKAKNESTEHDGNKKQKSKITSFAKKLFSRTLRKQSSGTSLNKSRTPTKTPVAISPASDTKTLDFSEKTAKSFRKRVKNCGRSTKQRPPKEKAHPRDHSLDCPTVEKSSETSADKPPPPAINGEAVEKAYQKMGEEFKSKDKEQQISECWDCIEDIEVADDNCQHFLRNEDKNQAEEIECLDANRVKLDRPSSKLSDYIHASYVQIKKVDRKFILTQLPKSSPQLREDFWTMVYQQPIHNMYILCNPDESNRSGADRFSEYFPLSQGQHEYYGSIWVHNRKAELANEAEERFNDVYTIEVLPEGCAESVMITIHICMYWPESSIPTLMKKVIPTATNLMGREGSYESDPICIVSKLGAGRPGTFLAIASAIDMLKNGNVPNMKEIVVAIRSQRPGAIDTEAQLVFAFYCVIRFVANHVISEEAKKKAKNDLKTIQNQLKALNIEVPMTEKD